MNFGSRKSASDELMRALKDDGVAMIGLYGMGGCGKTTLAKEVMKTTEAEHLFDKVLFVSVSSTVEVSRIQEKISSSLQYTFPEKEEMERSQRLCQKLIIIKKILIILDDVWEKLDFRRIGIPPSEHHKGCKILITTRSEDVCTSMDCQRVIHLPILTPVEAWTLFQNKALISEDTPETIKDLAKSISNKCNGLPVAIAAVASTLKGKAEVRWSDALNRLRRSKPINIEKGLRDPYQCLQLSYDNLDTKEAKSLFLLCSVFPEDYEIPVECLIRCAIGLGVAEEVDSYEEARIEVIAAKMKLVSSCLLDFQNESVKMHDLVRDVAHWIAKNDKKIIKCETEKDVTLEQSPIRYLWCVKFPDDMDCSNLEFLCIQAKLEVSEGIFERMGKLRVLIITNENTDKELQLSTLSFKTLTNLRCLVLQYWKLSDISFVRVMKKLQSLSLHGCSWPSFLDLQTNVALKLLEFNRCYTEMKDFEEIKRIPLLEELYIIDPRYTEKRCVEFFNRFSVAQPLRRYGIVFGDYSFQPIEFFFCERTLLLKYFDISNEVINGLAKEAKVLDVTNIKGGAKNMMPGIFKIEGGMNELNELRLFDGEEIECLVDTSYHLNMVGNLFSKLHVLKIERMKHLRALWHGCLPANGCFEKLEKLYLRDCPELTSLFTIVADDEFTIGHSVQSKIFQNLQEVQVRKCGELKHVFSASIIGGLPQLKWLYIRDCDKIEEIIGNVDPSAHHDKNEERDAIIEEDEILSALIVNHSSGSFLLSSLVKLSIESCPMLGSLFETYVAKTLTSLEELFIFRCHGLKHIVTHARVENMVEDDHDFQSDLSMFPTLKRLNIHSCDSLQHIFPRSMLRFLPELHTLEVRYCKELRQIIEEDLEDKNLSNLLSPQPCFPKLRKLAVGTCHKLKYLASVSASNDFPDLEILVINGATELEEFIRCEYNETGNTEIELPELKLVIFTHLSEFRQETKFLNVKHRIVRNCPKLSLTSTTTLEEIRQSCRDGGLEDYRIPRWEVRRLLGESARYRELPSSQLERDSTPENASSLQTNQEDPPTFENKACSSQVNDNNQSMLGSTSEMVLEHKKIEIKTLVSETEEFQKIDRKSERTSYLKAIEQNLPVISSPNMTESTDEIETNTIGKTPTSEKIARPTSVLENIEEMERQRTEDGPPSEGAAIKTLSIGVDNISLGSGVTIHKSSGTDTLSQYNEDETGIAPYKSIKIQEGANLLDKTKGTGIASDNRVEVTPGLEEYKHFVGLDDSQISLLLEAIAAYPHLWNACEKFSDRFQAWMLKTLADMLLFLRSESLASVNPQQEKEFHKLCDEAIQLGFERSWVDEMRLRVVKRDPKLDHAKARIGELLKRHDHLTQQLDNIKKELRSLNDFVDAQTKCFDFL